MGRQCRGQVDRIVPSPKGIVQRRKCRSTAERIASQRGAERQTEGYLNPMKWVERVLMNDTIFTREPGGETIRTTVWRVAHAAYFTKRRVVPQALAFHERVGKLSFIRKPLLEACLYTSPLVYTRWMRGGGVETH
jgi:hypothetical protein